MAFRTLTPIAGGRALLGLAPLLDLHRDMNRIFDGALRNVDGRHPDAALPRIEVQESDEEFRLLADIPGLGKDDVELTIEGDMLTIAGERKAAEVREGSTWHIAERVYGSFTRSVKLPFAPDAGRVVADVENGVLTVCVPKAAAQERGRRIAIGAKAAESAQASQASQSSQAAQPAGGTRAADAAGIDSAQRVIDKAAARQPQSATA